MMDIAEGILSTAAKEILGSYQVNWLGVDIDLTPGWPRMTMTDAVKQYVGVDFDAISDDEEACRAVEAKASTWRAVSAPGAPPCTRPLTSGWRRSWCSPPSSPCTRWRSPR